MPGVHSPGMLFSRTFLSLGLAALPSCLTPTALRPLPDRFVADLLRGAEEKPLGAGEDFRHQEVHRSERTSVHLVQVRGAIKPHLHRRHDETVCILAGEGIMNIAEEEFSVRPGVVLEVPAGMVHSFRTAGERICVALVIYAPPFDGEDRQFIE